MPFSDEHNAVFIHVPKTAGTSVEVALDMQHRKNLFEFDPIQNNFKQHWPATQVRKRLGPEKYDEMFSFAFVRHPISRMLSEYHYLKRLGSSFVLHQSPDSFIKKIHDIWGMWEFYPREMRQHIRTQTFMLYNEEGKLMVDFVGKFENLQEDWQHVCDQLGISEELPFSQESANKDDWSEFSEESIATIRKLYADDFKNFDYE